ncbi:hypothetical protein FISHEDRAFT_68316 [Fistulina hepatica ATCC 64428]|uniref:VPS8-like TPR-like repeats domain-containing protein n=1 Tax=Fistulina hepatica ATCC 64428 TaxID=1128425 RepID=A0A0D7ARH6_9AGAR|nr:hypothetical protein FISHEDRAFT_68316 [Fistulina hepatica ATCC 64428]
MLTSLGCMGVSICLEQSNKPAEVPLEDVWFRLLSSQISCVQMVSSCAVAATDQTASEELLDALQEETLSTLRTIVQDTFASLVSITSTRTVSFPRLFTRLVDAATNAAPRSHYDEFRAVLTGMLESYRSDGDMLAISKRLQDRDLYVTLLEQVRARARGWKASRGICAHCKKPLENLGQVGSVPEGGATLAQIVVSRTGIVHHASCAA